MERWSDGLVAEVEYCGAGRSRTRRGHAGSHRMNRFFLAFSAAMGTIRAMSQSPFTVPQSPEAEQSAAAPTRVRFLIVGLVTAMSVLLYLDRFAITPATDTMLRELSLNKEQFGQAVGAFFLAYALMQIPSGWLTDTLGARWLLAIFVVGWSLATVGLGLAQGFLAIWSMRLLLGIMQAGAYPTAAGLLKHWIPYSSRGLANSIVSMGGRCGNLLSLLLTVPCMLLVGRLLGWQSDQWRVVFVVYGALGVVWGLAFVWFFRDRPDLHPRCNAAEVELIASGPAEPATPPDSARRAALFCGLFFLATIGWILAVSWLTDFVRTSYSARLEERIGAAVASALVSAIPIVTGLCGTLLLAVAANRLLRRFAPAAGPRLELPLAEMLVSKEMWLMCAINFLVNIGWIFLATWLPQYLIENHGPYLKSQLGDERLVAALITAVVGLAAIGGGLSGGRATDVFARRFGGTWGRRLPGMIAGVLVCGMYLVVPHLEGLWPFVGAMIAIAFVIDFGLGASWASNQDIGGRHVASILGCGNMCGNLGAAYFGERIGYLAHRKQWDAVFYIAAGAMLLVACCWLFFDARRPVVREDERVDGERGA